MSSRWLLALGGGVGVTLLLLWLWTRAPAGGEGAVLRGDVEPVALVDPAESAGVPSLAVPEEPSREPAAVSMSKLLVRTTDSAGVPLPGVELSAAMGEVVLSTGVSEKQGTWSLSRPVAGALTVRAKHLGRFEATADVAPESEEVVIALDMGGAVRGRVVLPDGKPAPLGTCVLAWSTDSPRTSMEVAQLANLGDWELQTSTDSEGAFAIYGLDREQTYSVTAGGKGLMRKQPFSSVAPDGPELVLEVFPAYGAVVRLIDAQSRDAIQISEWFAPMGARSIRAEDTSLLHFFPGGAESILAGVAPKWLGRDGANTQHVVLCAAPGGGSAVGPFTLQAELPGYRELNFDFEARPLVEGLHIVDAFAEPLAEGWGEVRVTLEGTMAGAELAPHLGWPWALLHLRDPNGKTFRYLLPGLDSAPCSFRPIPAGDYDARVVFQDGLTKPSDWQAVKVGAEPVTLTVPVNALGTIQVVVRGKNGTLRSGRLGLTIQRVRGRQSPAIFDAAPYVIVALDPAEYLVEVMSPFRSERGGTRVSVVAGEVAVLEFEAP